MKVFISQPMTGLDPCEVMTNRELAEHYIVNYYETIEMVDGVYYVRYPPGGIQFIDSYLDLGDVGPLIYLGESIKLLDQADVMFVLPGWELSRGCELEMKAAKLYDIPIVFIDEL